VNPDDPRHGTTRGFHAGCRKTCCRKAIARYEKGTKHRRQVGIAWAIPALGTQRRIQALMRLGWTSTDIADAAGWGNRNSVLRILNGQKGRPCTWVERKTYRTIAEVFERLAMRFPEPAPHRARTRTIAARKGWHFPLEWDDPDTDPTPKRGSRHTNPDDIDLMVVDRLLHLERVPSTRAEKETAMRRWIADGRSRASLSRAHGWKDGRYTA
jgi:hypothetical protein